MDRVWAYAGAVIAGEVVRRSGRLVCARGLDWAAVEARGRVRRECVLTLRPSPHLSRALRFRPIL